MTTTNNSLPVSTSIIVGGNSQYTTIQQGIVAAERTGNHSIVVTAGTYTENDVLTAADNGLTISAASAGVTLAGSVNVTSAANITISGLTFHGNGSNVAINALNSTGLTFSNNSFTGTGEAVLLDGTTNSTVANSIIANTTNSAIEAKNGANGVIISNNAINGVSTQDTTGAIWLHGSNNSSITNNQITNTTGAAISLSDFYGPGTTATQNNNVTIAYNSLNNVDTQSQDSGAIYILGRSQNPNSNDVVKMNFIGTTGSAGAHAVGVYLDDNASGVLVTQNIIQASSTMSDAYQIHGGSNNTFTANIFDLGTGSTDFGLFQKDEANLQPVGTFKQLQNDVVSGNVFTTESQTPHNPGFVDLTSGIGNVSVSNNDFWAYSGASLNVGGSVASGDSAAKYVAPASQAAQSLSGYSTWSAAGIGFKAIPTSQIGLLSTSSPVPAPNPVPVPVPVPAPTPVPVPLPVSPPAPTPSSPVIKVGGGSQYTTIQQGIAAAEHAGSHSVVIAAGNYTENDVLSAADNGLTISAAATGVNIAGSLSIANASQITISGLAFHGNGSNVAIDALNSTGIKILNDTFTGTGQAILLDGTTNSSASNNLITNTTNSAIEAKNGANGLTISNNMINGVRAPDTVGAVWLHGSNNSNITNNQITNTTGAAISLSDFYGPGTTTTQNTNDTVAYNSLNNVDTQSQDSGAIYLLGRSQDPNINNVVKMNFIGTTGSAGAHAVGVYLDDNTSGVVVTQNIVQASSTMSDIYEIHGGSNNTVTANIFDLGTGSTSFGLAQQDEANLQPVGSFVQLHNDLVSGNIYTTESLTPSNPGFANLTNGIGNLAISGNDFWAYSAAPLNVGGTGANGDSGAKYVAPAGQSAHSLSDYASWSGGGIGFQSINTSQIGLAPVGARPY